MLVVATALAAGCSATAATGSAPAVDSTRSSASAGLAAARAYLAPFLSPPKGILVDTPLKAKPPVGKLLVKLVYPTPTEAAVSKYTEQAAKLIGWNYKAISVAPVAQGIQQAFQSALQLDPAPAVIEEAGFDKATFAPQLAEAKRRGIGVITESATAPGGTGDGIIADLNGPPQSNEIGQVLAAWVTTTSGGKANVGYFNISSITVINATLEGFKTGLTKWCPGCRMTYVDNQITDLGTKLPRTVVSTLQRTPGINYGIFGFGDMTAGVNNALKAAGLGGKLKIGGGTADLANTAAIKAGTEHAWLSFNSPVLGYRTVDSAARFVEGSPQAGNGDVFLPEQLINADNVGSLEADSDGFYVGVPTYVRDFKKLWHVG